MNTVGMREEIYEAWSSIEDPYDRLAYIGKQILKENPEATFYDLFNTIREDVFKGWKYDEDSAFIRSIDFDIDYEIKHNKKRK